MEQTIDIQQEIHNLRRKGFCEELSVSSFSKALIRFPHFFLFFAFTGRRLRSAVRNIQGSAHARHQ